MSSQILLIDIGNTNLKWSLLSEGKLSAVQAAPHRNASAEQLALQCWPEIDPPDRIYLASVANETLCPGLSEWMWQRWHRKPQIIQPQASALGVKNGYDDPAQLGVDRWLTLLAVHTEHSGSACIVDCGTALTVDLLAGNGVHHGGLILPGLGLMRESLLSHTHIPRVGPVPINSLFATNTASAVASAAIHSAACLIERSMQELPNAVPMNPV